jgi:SAM-dependent methyltransferase
VPQPLDDALTEVRKLLLDRDHLVRAVATGRRRAAVPRWQRVEFRPVALKAGPQLQLVSNDGTRPDIRNLAWGADATATVDELLAEPFGNWHVETTAATVQVRVTKRGEAQVHRAAPPATAAPTAHDLPAAHLLDPGDPLFDVIGGNAAKRRQVDAFLRALAATLGDDSLPERLRVVDLGCGNAYLTFAAFRYLSTRGLDVRLTGVDVRADQRDRNTALAERLGWADQVRFVAGTIADAEVDGADVVLALHACDTATDEALARAVGWQARWILAAPCCHHDIAAQLRKVGAPDAYRSLVRHGILRERFADVLTDALRANQLRLSGYAVEVVEFVDSAHTPRNLLLRARRTGTQADPAVRAEYAALVDQWQVKPALAELLDSGAAAQPGEGRE